MRPRLVLNSLEKGPRCIMIPIHLKTTDTLEEVNSEAMVDSGATGDFIDEEFIERLSCRRVAYPRPSRCTTSTDRSTKLVASIG